jgi:hypothetical protein
MAQYGPHPAAAPPKSRTFPEWLTAWGLSDAEIQLIPGPGKAVSVTAALARFGLNWPRASFQRFGFLRTVHGSQAARVVFEAGRHVGMLRAQDLFPDRQRPAVKGLGLRVLALGVVESRQVVEADGDLRVLQAQGFSRIASACSKSGSAFPC